MSTECYPIATLPHVTKLYRAYVAMGEASADGRVRGWYGAEPLGQSWMRAGEWRGDRERLADALEAQSREFGAASAALENIAKLKAGARAVVTGQQVGLFGGPLLTLLKAATAVARAKQATSTLPSSVEVQIRLAPMSPLSRRPAPIRSSTLRAETVGRATAPLGTGITRAWDGGGYGPPRSGPRR